MTLEDCISKKEKKILKQIGEDYSREECIQIWNEVRGGLRNRVPLGFWQKYNHRKYVFFEFLKEYQQDNPARKYPDSNDYRDKENKISGLFAVYGDSPYEVLKGMGFTNPNEPHYDETLDKTPWRVIDRLPDGYWDEKDNRARAINWLLEYTCKAPEELIYDDIRENGLNGICHHKSRLYELLREAGHDIKLHDMHNMTNSEKGWSNKRTRFMAITDLCSKLNKLPEEIVSEDLKNNGLGGVLAMYDGSPTKLLKDSGFNVDLSSRIKPVGYWRIKENRVKEVKALAEKLGRTPNCEDFKTHIPSALTVKGTYGLLEEADMKLDYRPMGYWKNPENRIKETRALVEKLGRMPKYVEFMQHMPGAIKYGTIPALLEEAGFEVKHRKPRGYWIKPENRIKEMRALADRLGEVPSLEFVMRDLRSALTHKTYKELLKEAELE